MEYYSTRDTVKRMSASEAISRGLAPDGGLYVPATLPQVSERELMELQPLGYGERAKRILAMYLPEYSPQELDRLVADSYGANFDTTAVAPLRFTEETTAYLELWHGPTAAFKDMALQMLPHLLTASLKKCGEERGVCILVATSGDTGKAALEGFADVPGTKILVFYPRDGVSDVQKLQMVTQTGENVGVCAVEGNFDDAQTGVKKIFGDRELAEKLSERGWFLSSANSINWGRLLPQIVYYFSAYCDFVNSGRIKCGERIVFCVPTGNFGNILAGWMAKEMGLPVSRFVCASNANNVLTDFIETGVYDRRRPFHVTSSPSMDILVSSNLERLLYFLSKDTERVSGWMSRLSADAVEDALEALCTADAEEAKGIIKGDTEVNRMERDIEHRCMTLLLRQQPVASDLRFISAAMKVVTDVERIGDHAADIAEIVPHLAGVRKAGDPAVSRSIEMGRKAHKMLQDAMSAFAAEDEAAAKAVIDADDAVDYDFNTIKRMLAAEIAADPGKVDAALDVLMVIKYLERIGDHAVNIAEWVEFAATGLYKGREML